MLRSCSCIVLAACTTGNRTCAEPTISNSPPLAWPHLELHQLFPHCFRKCWQCVELGNRKHHTAARCLCPVWQLPDSG